MYCGPGQWNNITLRLAVTCFKARPRGFIPVQALCYVFSPAHIDYHGHAFENRLWSWTGCKARDNNLFL